MPTTGHRDRTFVAGDDWDINGTLLDQDGNPLDLTNAFIAWALLDSSGIVVETNAIITAVNPPSAGMISIKLGAATTAAIAPGRYTDALRITRVGRTSTFRGSSIRCVARNGFA